MFSNLNGLVFIARVYCVFYHYIEFLIVNIMLRGFCKWVLHDTGTL